MARAATAQVTAGALVGTSTQAEGQSDNPYLYPPFGGTRIAVIGLVDAPLTGATTIGFEASFAGTLSGDQSQRASGGNNEFRSEHSDSVFIGTFKIGTPLDKAVRIAAVGGGGFAARRTTREGRFVSFNPSLPSGPFSETLSDVVGVVSGGVDVAALAFDHVGLLVAIRVHRLLDDDHNPEGTVRRGVSSTILRVGAGLLLRF